MNYSKIIYYDTANARGLSTVLFVSGCSHHCKNCFNPETWDDKAGNLYTKETQEQILESLKDKHVRNLVISGGDPMYEKNRDTILSLAEKVQEETSANVILYTGYRMDEMKVFPEYERLLKYIDIVVDGEFIEEQTSPILDFRGSLNQQAYLVTPSTITNISNWYFKINESDA